MPNFIEIEEIFCGLTDIRTYVRTDGRTFETDFIWSTLKSRPSNNTSGLYNFSTGLQYAVIINKNVTKY